MQAIFCRGNRALTIYLRYTVWAAVGLLVLGPASSQAQTTVRQVLVLQSVDRGNLVIDYFTNNFRASWTGSREPR
jgi:hypothetical protein